MVKLETMEQVVSLAGLLHDIGKFTNRSANYRNELKDKKKIHSYKHPFLSKYFIEFLEDNKILEKSELTENLKELVLKHHESQTFQDSKISVKDIEDEQLRRIGSIISNADNYSSMERYEQDENEQESKDNWQKKPLNSIFEHMGIENKNKEKSEYFYEIQKLSYKSIFPRIINEDTKENIDKNLYSQINNFMEEVKLIEAKNYNTLFSQLYSLLEKYTWCIASDTQTKISDISLFDHLKTTSGLALASYIAHKENGKLEEGNKYGKSGNQFLLLAGDISGIQNFIYDGLKASNAAKILRGKSFFVKAISDVVTYNILKELKLDISNVVLSSGGKFYILASNTKNTIEKIEEIKRNLNKYLYNKFYGQLYFNLVHIEAKGQMIADEFSEYIKVLEKKLNEQKVVRYEEEIRENPIFLSDYDEESGKTSVDKLNEWFKSLGEKLPKAKYIGIVLENLEKNKKLENEFEIINNGYICLFEKEKDIDEYKKIDKIEIVMNINDTEVLRKHPIIFKFISNYTPTVDNKIKTFEEISESAIGNKKIGVYKADVDNLGILFSEGLKMKENNNQSISLSRVSTLSRNLEYFFSYWMREIFKEKNHSITYRGKNNIIHNEKISFEDTYVLYSGGDDLLLIAPWDKMIALSYFIRENFRKFTTENEDITISGGIALSAPKTPIIYAVEGANIYEERSKEEGKDRLTVFNKTLKWNKFEEILSISEKIYELAKEKNEEKENLITQAFLYRCLKYTDMAEKFIKNKDVMSLTYVSKYSYDYSRNISAKLERIESKEIKTVIDNFDGYFREILEENSFLTSYMRILLNYVVYKNRKTNKN